MAYLLLFARDEMRKRHFVYKINDKTSKNYEKRKLLRKRRGESEDAKFFACVLCDVDLIMCNKGLHHCILRFRPVLPLILLTEC